MSSLYLYNYLISSSYCIWFWSTIYYPEERA